MRCALSVAGSDSIGGAGIQADIKAMAAVGVHAHTVITALTAQNTCSVSRIMPVPEDMIQAQIESVFSDSDVRAVKTGMLYSADIVKIVAEELADRSVPIVTDPVLVAGVGDALAGDGVISALKKELIPLCDILTPNRYEAEALSGIKINNEDDARRACEILGKEGSTIYLKGGHMDSGTVVDTLYNGAEFVRFEYPRLERAGHGGGCTLSAYITAHLAKGIDAVNSIIQSREIIQESIATMYVIGNGDKVVNPMAAIGFDHSRLKMLTVLNAVSEKIIQILPKEWILQKGINMGFATSASAGIQDIAVIEGGMTGKGSKNAKFGIRTDVSDIISAVTKHDAEQRSALGLMAEKELGSLAEEMGMSIVTARMEKDISAATSKAIKKYGSVPDAIVYEMKGKRSVAVLGRSPEDILKKIDNIL